MLRLVVRHSPTLLEHLQTHLVDGTTVADALFEGGRLHYPGRQDIEQQLGYPEPYTLEHEARVLDGLFPSIATSIRFLAREVASRSPVEVDPTLDLLWRSHGAYVPPPLEGPSLDRLVAALCMVELARGLPRDGQVEYAATVLVRGLNAAGFPSGRDALDEIWEDAPPACVGLGLVQV